jgi:hypothetical protein
MIEAHTDAARPAGGGNLAGAVEEGVIPECHEEAQPLAEHASNGVPPYARNLRMCWATVHTSPRWLATSISARVLRFSSSISEMV